MPKIKLKINNKSYTAEAGQTILEVAKEKGVAIPSLCYHPDFCVKGNCRVCVVEVAGRNKLTTACTTKAENGMEVLTDSDKVRRIRKINLELIYAEHIEKCAECIWRFECKLLQYARDYKIILTALKDRKGKRKTYKFANAVELDASQCIDCRNCVEACSERQGIHYLEIKGKGAHQSIEPSTKKDKHCILCGQCAVHCPVSAAQEQANWKEVEADIRDTDKIVIAQFAPAVRASIGEDFGMEHDTDLTSKIVSGLRTLGFDQVFDVNFGADLTTVVEAEELIERLTEKDESKKRENIPMITSCCPGWVNYVEAYHPELIPHLTLSRSPQIHNGGVIKTYWAEKTGIDPKRIRVVSIMPCTAKKYEAARPELMVNGLRPVDYVLTVRELTFMLKKAKIDFPNLADGQGDDPLSEFSGAGAIFGASGGVMESALRTAEAILNKGAKGKLAKVRVEFKEARGLRDVKEAEIVIAGIKVRIAVVNGIKHFPSFLPRFKDYHYVEVMACPGGCIGGGGQPISDDPVIIQKRMEVLYRLDKGKMIRNSKDNLGVKKVVDWIKEKGIEGAVLYTGYGKK